MPPRYFGGEITQDHAELMVSRKESTASQRLRNTLQVSSVIYWNCWDSGHLSSVVSLHKHPALPAALPPSLPIGWTSLRPMAVKDDLFKIYPWKNWKSQDLSLIPFSILIFGLSLDLSLRTEIELKAERHRALSLFSGVLGLELGVRQSHPQNQYPFPYPVNSKDDVLRFIQCVGYAGNLIYDKQEIRNENWKPDSHVSLRLKNLQRAKHASAKGLKMG